MDGGGMARASDGLGRRPLGRRGLRLRWLRRLYLSVPRNAPIRQWSRDGARRFPPRRDCPPQRTQGNVCFASSADSRRAKHPTVEPFSGLARRLLFSLGTSPERREATMMGRRVSGWLGLALGAAMALPGIADAQIRVHVDWQWGHDRYDGVRVHANGTYTYRYPRIGAVRYQPLRYVRVTGIRIPRGFRPARGMCRLWYPGVAPGQQPRPVRCEALRGRFHPDVLVVTWRGILRPVWDRYDRVRYGSVRAVDYLWYGDRYSRNDAYYGEDRWSRDGRWRGDRWEEWDDRDWWDDERPGDDGLRRDDRRRRDSDARSRGNRNGAWDWADRGRTDRPGQRDGRGRGAVNGRGPGG
jgi:hypothetical protein